MLNLQRMSLFIAVVDSGSFTKTPPPHRAKQKQ